MADSVQAWARMASKMVQAAPVWAKMARQIAQPRNEMGHPDLSGGGSRRFREVFFSEGFWLKVIWFSAAIKSRAWGWG